MSKVVLEEGTSLKRGAVSIGVGDFQLEDTNFFVRSCPLQFYTIGIFFGGGVVHPEQGAVVSLDQ